MKRSTYYFILFLHVFITNTVIAQSSPKLKFADNGLFKIVQFTDIHWKPAETKQCAQTKETIEKIVVHENPDLIIITGDIVNYELGYGGWQQIAAIFESFHLPWTIVLGNHDGDAEAIRREIFDLMASKTYFIGKKGPLLSGAGNYTLPIMASHDSTTCALLYFLDSHSSPKDQNLGRYDWIKQDQIEWYRMQSRRYTVSNNNYPLPALAFFHIPLPEYNNKARVKNRFGHKHEKVSSPYINSGLYATLLNEKDVMATFCGHDHSNDYVSKEHKIALIYGRKTGFSGTSTCLRKGARVILMYENLRKFDTWIRTPKKAEYHYSY